MIQILLLVLFFGTSFFEGNSPDDFITQLANSERLDFSVSTQNDIAYDAKAALEEPQNDNERKVIEHFKDAIYQTKYKKYFNEKDLSVDFDAYVKDILKEEGIKWTGIFWNEMEDDGELEEEYYDEQYETYNDIKWVRNCLFCVNKKGEVVVDTYYVFVTKDKELVEALEKEGLTWVVSGLKIYEKQLSKKAVFLEEQGMCSSSVYKGNIGFVNNFGFSVGEYNYEGEPTKIMKETQWLQSYQEDDAWGVSNSNHNNVCDYLEYSHSCPRLLWESSEYKLRVFGQKGEIKEIVYTRSTVDEDKDKKEKEKGIPKELQPTIKNYLIEMGATESQAESMMNTLKDEKGSVGKVSHFYESNWYEERYRFYVAEN